MQSDSVFDKGAEQEQVLLDQYSRFSCQMIDGPMCNAFDQQYGHSNLLYKDLAAEKEPWRFSNLWLDAKRHQND